MITLLPDRQRGRQPSLSGESQHSYRFLHELRKIIASKLPSYDLPGEVEADESYFGGIRKGKRGKVYTAIIPNAKTETLLPIIKEKVQPDSIVYTDTWRSYNALNVSDFHHERINHSVEFADEKNHINGIENFWNQAKRHLCKFNGIRPASFYWFLKECEWRFNGGSHQKLLSQLRCWYWRPQK